MPKRKRAPDTRPSASIRLKATHKQVSGYVPNANYATIEAAAGDSSVFAFMLEAALRAARRKVKPVVENDTSRGPVADSRK